jgi:hypothetical protein
MKHIFVYVLSYTHTLIVHHFMRLWLVVLLLALGGGWLLSRINGARKDRRHCGKAPRAAEKFRLADGVAIAVFCLFVCLYIAQMVYGEDFGYYDNDQLTDFSAVGNAFRPPIWPVEGRFFPLGHQEFNFLQHFTRTAAGYQCIVAVQLVVLLAVAFVALRECKPRYRVLTLVAIMTAPSFLVPFCGLIYPDRNVLFWLGILVFCLAGYEKHRARTYFLGCLAATQFVLYYKETVVVFLAAYCLGRLLLETYLSRRAGNPSWRQIAKENSLTLAMMGITGIYCVLFVVGMSGYSGFSYVSGLRLDLKTTVLAYVETDWLLPVFVLTLVWRLYRSLRRREQLDPVWEPLAWGALAYVLSLVALRLFRDYYLALFDLVAFLYLAHVLADRVRPRLKLRTAIVATVLACIVLHNAAYSALNIVERKTVIQLNRELADFLEGYRPSNKTPAVELFFPWSDGYRLMELSSYFNYRGLPVAGQTADRPSARPTLIFEGTAKFPNGLCVAYKQYRCVTAASPPAGGLGVILPDDRVSPKELAEFRQSSTELLSREPWPVHSSKEMWLRALHAMAWEYWRRREPQHLWQLHVFRKTT